MHHASRSVDGLLISLSSGTVDLTFLKELYDKGLPIVFFDRITDEIDTHKVTANNYMGAFQATEHLIYQGFKKIAHITSSPFLSITKERLHGYIEALEKHHIPYNESLVKYCNHGGMIAEEVAEALMALFKGKNKPDAIFTAGDRITTESFKELKNVKQKVNVGFAGFTNSRVGELFDPPMTVVQQPAFQIGQTAIEMLIQMIESKRPVTDFETKILDTDLIIRESSMKKE
jgi:LacI family transcriptional regulator